MAKALKILLLNNGSAALCGKSLHLPGCPKTPWCKLQLVAANDVLLLDYRVSYTKKLFATELSNITPPEEIVT